MLTIFANLRVNDAERFQHLKDSFQSFKNISDDWLVNIRGNKRLEALAFLKAQLGNKGKFFELLDDKRGWINNALEMLPSAKYDYVLLWNEDHINVAPQEIYPKLTSEMKEAKADYIPLSFWLFGALRRKFDEFDLTRFNYMDTIHLTRRKWKKILKSGHPYYLITLVGIFNKNFLHKLMLKDRVKLPFFFSKNLYRILVLFSDYLRLGFDKKKVFHTINKLFFNKLPRFSQETPFNLEKGPWRYDNLPLTMALPKQELFACIDDDSNIPGSQLIKRNLYPVNPELKVSSQEKVVEQNSDYEVNRIALPQGQRYSKVYYEDVVRTGNLLKHTIVVLKGKIEVVLHQDKTVLLPGSAITIYPNLKYQIRAGEDSEILEIFSSLINKKIKFIYD